MPTYILHGGRTSLPHSSNKAFFQTMASHVPQGGTWLGCYFARLAEEEAVKFETDTQSLVATGRTDISLRLANGEGFLQQLATADVLYLAGGHTQSLLTQLGGWADIRERLAKVPVIAGSSAGMIALGLGGVGKTGTFYKGLGFVPYYMRVHHGHPDFAAADATPLPEPVLALPEAEFRVLNL